MKLVKRKGKAAQEEGAAMEEKKQFERVWSEQNEIELIEGMIAYSEKKGKDPMSNVNDFHDFVKPSLNVDVDNAQMTAKMKRLKRKFRNNANRIAKDGKVKTMSNPHEKKMYEFSLSLWGEDKTKKSKENQGSSNSKELIRFPLTDEDFIKRGIELAPRSKKAELEKKLEELEMEEFEHHLNKFALMKEQGDLLLNAMKEYKEDEDKNVEDTRTNRKKPKTSRKSAHDKVEKVQDVREEMSPEKNTETTQVMPDIGNEIPSSPIRLTTDADHVNFDGDIPKEGSPIDFFASFSRTEEKEKHKKKKNRKKRKDQRR